MTFDEYFEWEKENVTHLESKLRIIENFGAKLTTGELVKKNKKTTTTHCVHCGAPVNPYKEQCEYCGCYY